MNPIRGVFAEYVSLRSRGFTQLDALNTLRGEIEVLTKSSKRELITVMRAWEKELNKRNGAGQASAQQDSLDKGLADDTISLEPLSTLEPADEEMLERHKRLTQVMPIVMPLDLIDDGTESGEYENTVIHGGTEVLHSDYGQTTPPRKSERQGGSRFDDKSTLKLYVLGADRVFELRPQDNEHELFVGRSTLNGALAPDVDLARCNGARMGVSQLHMSIRYLPDEKVLMVQDLSSTNGSFLNREPLFPDEPCVLRDGDEIRVGLLGLLVEIKQEIPAGV